MERTQNAGQRLLALAQAADLVSELAHTAVDRGADMPVLTEAMERLNDAWRECQKR